MNTQEIEKYAVSSGADPRVAQIFSAFQTAYQVQSEALKALENQVSAMFREFGLEHLLTPPTPPQPPAQGEQG